MKCGLVLEGGARRGLFGAGILDRFIENGIEFPYIIGVSAGAQAAMNFVSRQSGRTKFMLLPQFEDRVSVLPMREIFSRELYKTIHTYAYERFPFDFKTFFASETKCEIAATDCGSGGAEYFSETSDEKRFLDTVLASCSVPPVFSRVMIDGREYVDGCVADSVPFERAFEQGCDKVIIILTKPKSEPATDYRKMRVVLTKLYEQSYPELLSAMMDRFDRYNEAASRMEQYAESGKALILRPEKTYAKAFDTNPERLENAYQAGIKTADDRLREICEFAEIDL